MRISSFLTAEVGGFVDEVPTNVVNEELQPPGAKGADGAIGGEGRRVVHLQIRARY